MEPNTSHGGYYLPEEDNVDLKRYLSLFISNWYWFAITLFVALTLAYGINRYSEKMYSVSATLLIKDDQKGAMSTGTENVIPGGNIFKNQQNLKNEMGILKSFSLNNKAMKELPEFFVTYVGIGRRGIVEKKIYKSAPFKVIYNSLENQTIGVKIGIIILSEQEYLIKIDENLNYEKKMKFGEHFTEQGFNFIIQKSKPEENVYTEKGSNKYYFYFTDPQSLANVYRSKLTVEPIEDEASLVTLSVSGPVSEQETDYLNKLMDTYIKYGLDNKNQTADSTIKFIDLQLKVVLDSLNKAGEKLEVFRLKNRFIDISSEGALIQKRLETFENEKTMFELQLQYYKYLSEYLSLKNASGTIISPSVMGITDQLIIKHINELSALQEQKAKLGFNLEINQPAIELIDSQALKTREALSDNVTNGIASLEQSIAESNRKISDVELEIDRLPTTERKLINIRRKFDLNNTVYTYLLEKRSESGIARASNVSDNRIIDPASQFSSIIILPKTRTNYLIAFLLGLTLPMVLLALIDYFNNKVIDKKDIESKTKVPIIGYIGHSEVKSGVPVFDKPGSSFAESFRTVRTSLKYFVKPDDIPIISISSTISAEGKTFVAINLAAIISMLGKKVLLVGLDLRKPRINKIFEFNDGPGMSTYLSSNCGYKEIIKATHINNLFYVPSGPIPPNPAELIETDQMENFLKKAKQEFDYIIFDTPPVAIVTDALLLSKYANINLFIIRQRYTSRNTLELIEQLKNQGDLKNMAIVINDISLSGYYGYGMRYGYIYGYGYSYGYNYYGGNYYRRFGNSDKAQGYYTED